MSATTAPATARKTSRRKPAKSGRVWNTKRPGTRIVMERVEVTPAMAAEALSLMGVNRKLSTKKAQTVKAAIQVNRFEENGETVKFDREGLLVDGQHRLFGIQLANRPVVTWVAFNLSPAAVETLDRGTKRSAANVLELEGVHKGLARHMAKFIQLALRHIEGCFDDFQKKGNHVRQYEPYEILAGYRTQPEDFTDFTEKAMALFKEQGRVKFAPPSWWAATNWMIQQCGWDREMAHAFLTLVCCQDRSARHGIHSGPYQLSQRLIESKISPTDKHGHRADRLRDDEIWAYTIKAFNNYVMGRAVERLQWRAHGSRSEPFPRWYTPDDVPAKREMFRKRDALVKQRKPRRKGAGPQTL